MHLEEHVIESSTGEYSRRVWIMPSSGEPERLCVFLDGEFYVNQINAQEILGIFCEREKKSVTAIFVSHVNGEARHHDLTCNERYDRFIAEDVVNWARTRYPSLENEGHLIAGLSLSGLASAHISLTYPKLFPLALCQSGSFWFENEWLTSFVRAQDSVSGRFWLSVGDREVDKDISHPPTGLRQSVTQIEGLKNFASGLNGLGAEVRLNEFEGGHEMGPWKEELPFALKWLFS